jgi:hypothetical protein
MGSSRFQACFRFAALRVLLCSLVIAVAARAARADHHEVDLAVETEAAATPEAARPAAAQEAAGRVSRASFTTAVVAREPVDEIVSLTEETDQVLFFSEILGLEGHTVSHRWEFAGEVVAEVPFEIGGPRWRVHSSKRLQPSGSGEWSVEVVDATGASLARKSFTYAPVPQRTVPGPAAAGDSEPADAAASEVAEPSESAPLPAAPPQ